MRVDRMRRRRQRASLAARRHCEPLQRVRRDVGMPRAHLAPRDVAVAVRVETNRVVEVAQRDVPLAAQRRSVALDRQIGVAGLVRERRGRDERDDEQQNVADHLRTIATEATATSSIRVRRDPLRGDFQRSGVAGRTRRVDEDAQVGRFALDVPVRARKCERGGRSRSRCRDESAPLRAGAGCRRGAVRPRSGPRDRRDARRMRRRAAGTRCSARARRSSSESLLASFASNGNTASGRLRSSRKSAYAPFR